MRAPERSGKIHHRRRAHRPLPFTMSFLFGFEDSCAHQAMVISLLGMDKF